MSGIQVTLLECLSVEQQRELTKRVSQTVMDVLGCRPEVVRIRSHEASTEDFSVCETAMWAHEAFLFGPPDSTLEDFHQLVAEASHSPGRL